MSTSDQGDSVSVIPGTKSAREALFDRLAERHAQVKAAQLSRRTHVQMQPGTEVCEASKLTKQNDFLSNFLQTKTDILADLDRAADQTRTDSLSTSDLTKILDETLVRIENLQKRLNESSLYLTPFDCEQATLELKNLQTQFQSKREELLPTRKFKFTKNRVQKTTTPAVSEVTPTSEITEHSGHIPSSLTKFDERFSLTNFEHDCQLVIPKPGCTDTIGVENSVYLAQLNRCTVHVRDVCGNLIARGLQKCRVYIYPVAGSVWLENCHQCDFVLASRQLRIHQTTDCRLGLHMASRPIIENSTGLQVAPYRLQYAALQSDLTRAGLSAEVNLWREVEDFSHPNKRLTTGSPNWSILPETEWNSLKANE
ncbi:Tubulin-specific chaperone C [Fasciola hepatica]|uniref:Tubulin-specific chaperone C n=1 Tax=Fasciola hepatica TaxID=6192 RepID=A0A4E0R991_FASHE|nr:Tubulin-specific chaperone C [Fasciola hepatica]